MKKLNTILKIGMIAAAALLCTAEISAQDGLSALFGKSRKNNTKRNKDIPTVITARTMDVNMKKNRADLLGDVFVDDQDLTIRCNRMVILFEDKVEEKAKDGKAKDGKAQQGKKEEDQQTGGFGNKKPTRIECYEDVVITGKGDKDKEGAAEQKATAGKAVYDMIKDEILLTENPVLDNGANKVTGTSIRIIVNEERMIVMQGQASSREGLSALTNENDGKKK